MTPCLQPEDVADVTAMQWNFRNPAMPQFKISRGHYVLTTRAAVYPPSWGWRIIRRGRPMGVKLEAHGFTSYSAARLAGGLALAEFLDALSIERDRID